MRKRARFLSECSSEFQINHLTVFSQIMSVKGKQSRCWNGPFFLSFKHVLNTNVICFHMTKVEFCDEFYQHAAPYLGDKLNLESHSESCYQSSILFLYLAHKILGSFFIGLFLKMTIQFYLLTYCPLFRIVLLVSNKIARVIWKHLSWWHTIKRCAKISNF